MANFSVDDLRTPESTERVLRQFQHDIQGVGATKPQLPSLSDIVAQAIPQIQQQLQPFIQIWINQSINPFLFTYTSLAASTSLTTSVAYPQICVCTGSGHTQTLPGAGSATGQAFYFIQGDANSTVIAGTINGATNYSLASQYKYVMIVSLNGLWYIIVNN